MQGIEAWSGERGRGGRCLLPPVPLWRNGDQDGGQPVNARGRSLSYRKARACLGTASLQPERAPHEAGQGEAGPVNIRVIVPAAPGGELGAVMVEVACRVEVLLEA
jgi:hypothetical protein